RLAQIRKAAALVAAHMTAIAGELEGLRLQAVEEDLRLRLHALMGALQNASERMGVFVLTRRSEEELLVQESLERVRRPLALLEAYNSPQSLELARIVRRVMQLGERCLKLISRSLELMEDVSEPAMFRSYSLIKTLFILHP